MKKMGKLFVVEGPDGVGKTTIAAAAIRELNSKGFRFEYCSFPGKNSGTLGELVYRLHHGSRNCGVETISNNSLQILHVAAHVDNIEREILPMLRSGSNVILDRYWLSSYVYGIATRCDMRVISKAIGSEVLAWGKIKPEIIFNIQNKWIENSCNRTGRELSIQYDLLCRSKRIKCNVQTVENHVFTDTVSLVVDEILKVIHKIDNATARQVSLLPTGHSCRKSCEHKPSSLAKLFKPTIVYDTYWKFAAKRQDVFFSRLLGDKKPWTDDQILQEHKFTNAYRASDRVSQYQIRNVIYSGSYSAEDIFFRIMLFKFFNKIETWQLFERYVGDVIYKNFDMSVFDKILTSAIDSGVRIYSAAYIMPTGGRGTSYLRKHRMHLNLLDKMMKDRLPSRVETATSMKMVYEMLLSYPSIGTFLAYQFATDLNYSGITNFSETEFVVPGPGARNGLRKCFEETGGLTDAEIIQVVMEHQEEEFARLGLAFKTLWGRQLQLIDCQNLFCETDKYARVKHPEFCGETVRSRIKQRFTPNPQRIDYWYPPKWGINAHIRNGDLP